MPDAVAVLTDLMFRSKIEGAARGQGLRLKFVPSAGPLVAELDKGEVRLVMIDLSLPSAEALACVRAAAGHPCKPITMAFVSHVNVELARDAEQAGATVVLARSKFSAELPELLRRYCANGGAGGDDEDRT